jgi:Flp pilus assembly pilin Flp
MNPLNDPFVVYLRVFLGKHLPAARSGDRGASTIEWAMITGLIAIIALLVYAVLKATILKAANNINTGP